MASQNFSNHTRYIPLYHVVGFAAATFPLVVSAFVFFKSLSAGSGRLQAAAMLSMAVALMIIMWYGRVFALKAQDKAIRAEENLRYFAMSGKLLDPALTMSQIVALRFAPNNEFIDLAHRAVAENLSSKQIKGAIKNWKEDNNRA